MRNFSKTAEQGREIIRNNHRLDLTANDLLQLMETVKSDTNTANGILTAIGTAYRAGVAVGSRAAKREATACK